MFHSLREMRDRSRAEERFWKILRNQLIDLKNEKKWKHLDRRADLLCSACLLPPLLWHRPSPCPRTSSTFGDEDFWFLEISPPDSVLGIFSEPHLLWIIPFWKQSNRVSDWVFFFPFFFVFFSYLCLKQNRGPINRPFHRLWTEDGADEPKLRVLYVRRWLLKSEGKGRKIYFYISLQWKDASESVG